MDPSRPDTHEQDLTARGLRILLADDNKDAIFLLSRLIRTGGHEVHCVYDGMEALEAAPGFKPDVVLLDIGMPRLNGYDTARRMRQEPWGVDLTLIAITGWGQEEDKRRSFEAGFDQHLVKPVDPRMLLELLAGLARA